MGEITLKFCNYSTTICKKLYCKTHKKWKNQSIFLVKLQKLSN